MNCTIYRLRVSAPAQQLCCTTNDNVTLAIHENYADFKTITGRMLGMLKTREVRPVTNC